MQESSGTASAQIRRGYWPRPQVEGSFKKRQLVGEGRNPLAYQLTFPEKNTKEIKDQRVHNVIHNYDLLHYKELESMSINNNPGFSPTPLLQTALVQTFNS